MLEELQSLYFTLAIGTADEGGPRRKNGIIISAA
jgi:hypothetical protein